MPKATMEFVNGVGVCTIAINEPMGIGYVILSPVAAVLNVYTMSGMLMEWVSSSHDIVVIQVFISHIVQGRFSDGMVTPG